MAALKSYREEPDWWRADWLKPLSDGAVLAYSQLRSYCCTHGRRAHVRALRADQLAEVLGVRVENVAVMLEAAMEAGTVVVEGELWLLPDVAAVLPKAHPERSKKWRDKLRGEKDAAQNRDETVTVDPENTVTRHASEGENVTRVTLFGEGVTVQKSKEALRAKKSRDKKKARRLAVEASRLPDHAFVEASRSVTVDTEEGVTPRHEIVTVRHGEPGDLGSNEGVTRHADLRNVNVNQSLIDKNVTLTSQETVTAVTLERFRVLVCESVYRIDKYRTRGRQIPDAAILEVGMKVLPVTGLTGAIEELVSWEQANTTGKFGGHADQPSTSFESWFNTFLASYGKPRKTKKKGFIEAQEYGKGDAKQESAGQRPMAEVVETPIPGEQEVARRFGKLLKEKKTG